MTILLLLVQVCLLPKFDYHRYTRVHPEGAMPSSSQAYPQIGHLSSFFPLPVAEMLNLTSGQLAHMPKMFCPTMTCMYRSKSKNDVLHRQGKGSQTAHLMTSWTWSRPKPCHRTGESLFTMIHSQQFVSTSQGFQLCSSEAGGLIKGPLQEYQQVRNKVIAR